jgi:hypothetical protein
VAGKSLDAQVAQIKDRIGTLQQSQARAEHQRAVAEDALSGAMSALRGEFGVGTLQEAQARLEELDAEVGAECRRAAELLAEAGERVDDGD